MKLKQRVAEVRPHIRTVETIVSSLDVERVTDVRTDITDQDWKDILQALKELNSGAGVNAANYLNLALDMSVLFPERIEPDTFSESFFSDKLATIKSNIQNEKWSGYANEVWPLILMYPDRRQDLVPDEAIFDRLLSELSSVEDLDEYAEVAFALKLLFPDRRDEYELHSDFIQRMNNGIDACQQQNPLEALQKAFVAILVQPESKNEIHINKQQAMEMRQQMLATKGVNWADFMSTVLIFGFVMADEVRFTGQRYELVYRDELSGTTSLPERKIA